MNELITADEARNMVSSSVDDELTKTDIRDISREIRKKAESGLREVIIYAPQYGGGDKAQKRMVSWLKAARATLTGAGYDTQASQNGSGRFLVVRW